MLGFLLGMPYVSYMLKDNLSLVILKMLISEFSLLQEDEQQLQQPQFH